MIIVPCGFRACSATSDELETALLACHQWVRRKPGAASTVARAMDLMATSEALRDASSGQYHVRP